MAVFHLPRTRWFLEVFNTGEHNPASLLLHLVWWQERRKVGALLKIPMDTAVTTESFCKVSLHLQCPV